MSDTQELLENIPAPQVLLDRVDAFRQALRVLTGSEEESYYHIIEIDAPNGEKVPYVSYDDGSGNLFGLIITQEGSLLWGYDHESSFNTYSEDESTTVLDGVPEALGWILTDQDTTWNHQFSDDDPKLYATVALWRLADEDTWSYNVEHVSKLDDYDDGGLSYFFESLVDFNVESFLDEYGQVSDDISKNEDYEKQVKNIFDTVK